MYKILIHTCKHVNKHGKFEHITFTFNKINCVLLSLTFHLFGSLIISYNQFRLNKLSTFLNVGIFAAVVCINLIHFLKTVYKKTKCYLYNNEYVPLMLIMLKL